MTEKYLPGTNDTKESWRDIIRITEMNKPYWHKVVGGPVKVFSVFYPSEDDSGKTKTAALTVKDWKSSVFSTLAEMDRRIQKSKIYERMGTTSEAQEMARQVRSTLDPSTSFHCLVLDKKDEIPLVHRAEYKKSVRDKIMDMQSEKHIDEHGNVINNYLRYGLLIMLWFEIMRVEKNDSRLPKKWNVEYSVKVMEKYCEKFFGKVKSYLASDFPKKINSEGDYTIITPTEENTFNLVKLGILSLDELSAIMNSDYDLLELTKPMTYEDAIQKLENEPIKLDAMDENGNFKLPTWKELKELMVKNRLELPMVVGDTPRALSPSPAPVKEGIMEELDAMPSDTSFDFPPKEQKETVPEKELPKGKPKVNPLDEMFNDISGKKEKDKSKFDSLV